MDFQTCFFNLMGMGKRPPNCFTVLDLNTCLVGISLVAIPPRDWRKKKPRGGRGGARQSTQYAVRSRMGAVRSMKPSEGGFGRNFFIFIFLRQKATQTTFALLGERKEGRRKRKKKGRRESIDFGTVPRTGTVHLGSSAPLRLPKYVILLREIGPTLFLVDFSD